MHTIELLFWTSIVIIIGVTCVVWSDYRTWRDLQKRLEKERRVRDDE